MIVTEPRPTYEVGQLVMIGPPPLPHMKSWEGPARIVRFMGRHKAGGGLVGGEFWEVEMLDGRTGPGGQRPCFWGVEMRPA